MNIYERLDKILPKIMEERFRKNKGLGNEVGYYIFDYDPKDEMLVREHISFLKQKVNVISWFLIRGRLLPVFRHVLS